MPKYPKGKDPNSVKTQFKTDRAEACTAQVALRIPPSLKKRLKEKEGWQENVRKYMESLVKLESA